MSASGIWAPQSPTAADFLASPIQETGLTGTRGSGKSDLLLMAWAQHVGRGWGPAWKGVVFRRTYPALGELIRRSQERFYAVFPPGSASAAEYNSSSHCWTCRTGETLEFRYIDHPRDYRRSYHGQEWAFIGWDELTTWAEPTVYLLMMSCLRTANPEVRLAYRWTSNAYGPGHNWVKARFVDPMPVGRVYRDRLRLSVTFRDNPALLTADPGYPERIKEAARNSSEERAWLHDDWDITAGGMFDDIWRAPVHVLEPFEIPKTWRIDRSFDWGSSAPYSTGWWAESDGTAARINGEERVFPRGTLFRVAELYGWNGKPNEGVRATAAEVARRILEREKAPALAGRVRPGPADPNIYAVQDGRSIASEMEGVGVRWVRADAGPGSRRNGWELLRGRLKAALADDGESRRWPMEKPGLFVFSTCREGFIRTVPVLPRSDKDPDDVDQDSENHAGDEARYRVQGPRGHEGGAIEAPIY